MLETTPEIDRNHSHQSVLATLPRTGDTRRRMLAGSALVTGAGLVATTDAFGQPAMARALGKPLVDHRIYTIRLRKMGEFIKVFDSLAMPVLLKTLGHPLGFWTSHVGPLNQFVHLWGFDSLADYEQRGAALYSHADFPKYLAASEHLIVAQETRLIRSVALASLDGMR